MRTLVGVITITALLVISGQASALCHGGRTYSYKPIIVDNTDEKIYHLNLLTSTECDSNKADAVASFHNDDEQYIVYLINSSCPKLGEKWFSYFVESAVSYQDDEQVSPVGKLGCWHLDEENKTILFRRFIYKEKGFSGFAKNAKKASLDMLTILRYQYW